LTSSGEYTDALCVGSLERSERGAGLALRCYRTLSGTRWLCYHRMMFPKRDVGASIIENNLIFVSLLGWQKGMV